MTVLAKENQWVIWAQKMGGCGGGKMRRMNNWLAENVFNQHEHLAVE